MVKKGGAAAIYSKGDRRADGDGGGNPRKGEGRGGRAEMEVIDGARGGAAPAEA